MTRPTKDEYFLTMAKLAATRSTCVRRAVGCVLVDALGHVLATGYNGVARGLPHCNEGEAHPAGYPGRTVYRNSCPGAFAESGTNLEGCEAIHADQNALLQCRDTNAIDTAYLTISPCIHCTKMFLNTSVRRIVFVEEYAGSTASRVLWERAGGLAGDRVWIRPVRNADPTLSP